MGGIQTVNYSLRKLNIAFGRRLIRSGVAASSSSPSTQGGLRCTSSRTTADIFHRQRPFQRNTFFTSCIARDAHATIGPSASSLQHPHGLPVLSYHHHLPRLTRPHLSCLSQTNRQLSSRRNNKKKVDPNAPLLNEHLIAALMSKKKKDVTISADTYEVRLIVDQGRNKKMDEEGGDEGGMDDDDDDDDEEAASPSIPTTQITTVDRAITIAHELALDLMEVTLRQNPPVIKAVDFDKWLYEQKKKERQAVKKKKNEGGGAISDRPLKEFKFRAGIDDHDLERKAANMVKYLVKGHAVRVTLTARKRMLNADEQAIVTTLGRVKELLGDKAVEAKGLKANDRKSYGSLLFHPKKSKN